MIEMNPRVSRSSALASKATGFPIAKIAARLAVGYLLEEINNDITGVTPASFEPTIDYVVVKWPRFAFEKFPGVEPTLSTHMKSVGEAMAIGRTFGQAFAKALRSRELDKPPRLGAVADEELLDGLTRPPARALRGDARAAAPRQRDRADPRAHRDRSLVPARASPRSPRTPRRPSPASARSSPSTPAPPSSPRRRPTTTPAGSARASGPRGAPRRAALGRDPRLRAQPHRSGHRVRLLLRARRDDRARVRARRGDGQLQSRDRLHRLRHLRPPLLRAAHARRRAGRRRGRAARGRDRAVRRPDAAEARRRPRRGGRAAARHERRCDRPRRGPRALRRAARAPRLQSAAIRHRAQRRRRRSRCGEKVGFPLLVRPSYVLGGRAMEIVYSRDGLADYLRREVRPATTAREIFLDRFLENAIEVDVDALCDGHEVWIGGIMQHVEEAGVHSGDSACVLPPHSLGGEMLEQIRAATRDIALAIGVVGLLNVQYAVVEGQLYVIEANPRASRTVPFVSKAVGLPLAKLACRIMLGERDRRARPAPRAGRARLRRSHLRQGGRAAVRPLRGRRRGARSRDALDRRGDGYRARLPDRLRQGPGRRRRAAAARWHRLHLRHRLRQGRRLRDRADPHDNGFRILATRGTAEAIERMGVRVEALNKIGEGSPHVVDWIERGDVDSSSTPPPVRGSHRRLGDPPRRRARGDPLPDHARRPASPRRARSRAPAQGGAAAGALPAGAPPRAGRASERRLMALAPFGPAAADASPGSTSSAPTACCASPTPTAPRPRPASSRCSPPPSAGGRRGRATLPGARLLLARWRDGEAHFLLEDVGPGTRRLCELRRRRAALGARPARHGFSAPHEGRRAMLLGGGVGIAPLAIWQDALLERAASDAGASATSCWASATARVPPARRCCATRASPPTTARVGHHGLVTDLLAAELERDPHASVYACGPAPMLEAVRALCAERAFPPSSRSSPAWPAASAPATAASCPARRRLPARLRRRPGDRRRRARARRGARRGARVSVAFLRPRARAPRHQRLRHLRPARRAAAFGERAAMPVPLRRVRLEDDHPGAPRRQSAAAAVRGPGRADQLDRPAQQGPRGLSRRGSARDRCALAACRVPLITNVMGSSADGDRALLEPATQRARSPRSS